MIFNHDKQQLINDAFGKNRMKIAEYKFSCFSFPWIKKFQRKAF